MSENVLPQFEFSKWNLADFNNDYWNIGMTTGYCEHGEVLGNYTDDKFQFLRTLFSACTIEGQFLPSGIVVSMRDYKSSYKSKLRLPGIYALQNYFASTRKDNGRAKLEERYVKVEEFEDITGATMDIDGRFIYLTCGRRKDNEQINDQIFRIDYQTRSLMRFPVINEDHDDKRYQRFNHRSSLYRGKIYLWGGEVGDNELAYVDQLVSIDLSTSKVAYRDIIFKNGATLEQYRADLNNMISHAVCVAGKYVFITCNPDRKKYGMYVVYICDMECASMRFQRIDKDFSTFEDSGVVWTISEIYFTSLQFIEGNFLHISFRTASNTEDRDVDIQLIKYRSEAKDLWIPLSLGYACRNKVFSEPGTVANELLNSSEQCDLLLSLLQMTCQKKEMRFFRINCRGSLRWRQSSSNNF